MANDWLFRPLTEIAAESSKNTRAFSSTLAA